MTDNKLVRRRFLAGSSALLSSRFARCEDGSSPDDSAWQLPVVPYGAVYYRKSNPPRDDWQQDYRQAAGDGLNTLRHWFIWSAIEIAPGEYDFSDYDRHLDLAAEHGLKTIIGVYMSAAPQWAFSRFAEARVREADGTVAPNHYTRAAAVGGWPGLCFDNNEVRNHAEEFLQTLATRYRDHPGMGGYDLWNELNQLGDAGGCYCDGSAAKFRSWLKDKYGDLRTLGEAWYRYSYTDWNQVQIPRTVDPYPDSIDWALFRVDNAVRLLDWRIDVVRSIDEKNPITMHAIPSGVLDRVGPKTYPVFQAGRRCDIYGYSGGGSHDESSHLRWKHWLNMDLVRSAAEGKPFWCAEMAAGNQWKWRNPPLDRGRVSTANDVRLYCLMHLAGGTRGTLSPRWLPLQDGPFADSFGIYALDGSPTPRSKAIGDIARWANDEEQRDLMQAQPVNGEVGMLVVPESQIHDYVSEGNTDFYYHSIVGAYQGFLLNNIQPDFVDANANAWKHDLIYLPYPMMLPSRVARRLRRFVRDGGTLICEGLPAFFVDGGRAQTTQPGLGLDEVFGVREASHQLTPDLLEELTFSLDAANLKVRGGAALQTYRPTTGEPIAHLDDGRVVGVEHRFGKGRTLLIGTFPGYGRYRYADFGDEATTEFFDWAFRWSGRRPMLTVDHASVIARLHRSPSSTYLWLTNATRQPAKTSVTLNDESGPLKTATAILHEGDTDVRSGTLSCTLRPRSVSVFRLA